MEAVNLEFEIEVEEEEAVDMFDMTLKEAADFLEEKYSIKQVRNPVVLDGISPQFALRVLLELWNMDSISRIKVETAIANLRWPP